MGNLTTHRVCAPLLTSDDFSTDEFSNSDDEFDFTEFQSYSYYGGIFRYLDGESTYHRLKHTIDCIFSIRRFEQWSFIKNLDLQHQKLTGIFDLSTILPFLESLVLSDNFIQELSGLPVSLQTLKVNRNRLTDINGILPLTNLQYLDICNNSISSFRGMEMLEDLIVLHAENNKVKSCITFQFMRSLKHLNLRGNRLDKMVFNSTCLENLETLDVSYNRIGDLEFTKGLAELRVLKLEHNELESLVVKEPMVKLKSLYLCFNRLTEFNGSLFPALRTLHANDNHISRLLFMDSIPGLTEISLRDQCGQLGDLDLQHLASTRNLLLAGNPLQTMRSLVDFSALEYLELCSTELEILPHDFSQQAPNIAVLCLGHNYLSSIEPLRKLRKLHKLVLVNNRLKNINSIAKCLRSLDSLHYVDLRDNPMSFRYYPTTVTDIGPRKQPCQCAAETRNSDWGRQDNEYLRELSPMWLQRRSIYRALIIKSSSTLVAMDGVHISSIERHIATTIVSQHYQQHQHETNY